MATKLLRTIDRWRFELPMAVLLAGAAGFAVMAMPHDLIAQVPLVGDAGRAGQGAMAAVVALVCAIVGYVAMRRPAKRRPLIEEDEDVDLFVQPDAVAAPAPTPESGPVRLRRADRHPDAPAREPIRASRDLGEPFMDVAPLVPAQEAAASQPVEGEALEADIVELEAPVELVEQADTDQPIEEPAVQHDQPLPVAPETMPIAAEAEAEREAEAELEAAAEPEPVLATPSTPLPLPRMPAPVVEMPVRSARRPFVGVGRREDTSLSAMIDRLSEGMKLRGETAVGTMEPPRDRSLALRDALDELNRLAARRG